MSVKLVEQRQQKTYPVTKKTQSKHISKTLTRNQTRNAAKKVTAQEEEKTVQSASAKQKNTVSKARVVSLIYKELNNHFTYPKIAQKRNWQGQVLLAFRLSSNGSIEDININHSSGYNVLDQAAIASSWLINGMEIQIPIIYQLTKG